MTPRTTQRAGELADEIVRRLVYEAGGGDTDSGAVLFQVTQLRPILDDLLSGTIEQQQAKIDELERVIERLHGEATKGASM